LAAGTAVVVTRAHGRRAPVQALNVPEPSATTPDIGRGPAQDAASLAAVPVVEEHRRRHSPGNGTVLVTPSRLGVVQLGAASGVLAEQGARLRTRVLPDSSLVVTLVHGEGLFSIEPGDLPGLQVSTPHVRIRVLGTVFRVSVDSVRTTVRVLQGTVRLEAGGREVVLTPDGERVSAVATDDSLLVRMVDEGALTLVRRRLLRTYLSYLANADAGPETDSAVGARVDSLEAGLLRSPPAGAVLRDAEPLLLLRTARKLVRAGRHAEAERLYERLVKEDVCGAVGQYAAYRRARILLNAYGDPAAASTAAGQALGCAQAGPIGPELATIRMAAAVRAGVADTAVPVLEGFVREYPGAPEAEWAAFQCAQFLRLERTDWKAALQYYAYVVDSFPAGRYREDATYWAGQCLAQVGAQRFENRFFGLYDSAFPEGNWRFLVGPR